MLNGEAVFSRRFVHFFLGRARLNLRGSKNR
jgi:hypothetical protein